MNTNTHSWAGVALLLACLLLWGGLHPPFVSGQESELEFEQENEEETLSEDASLTYQGVGEVDVKNENYVAGRNRAVVQAFRNSLDDALRDMLGAPVYQANRKTLASLFRRPRKFIRSYRFLSAEDNPVEKVSRVKLEVQFYKQALNRELNSLGVLAALVKPRTVLVLIVEKSVSFDVPYDFWETVPIAEVALYTHLLAEGIDVIKRADVLDKIPQDLVLQAVGGDLNATVEIGLKAAADVVIVGSALSSVVSVDKDTGMKTVQANLNFRAVSSVQSVFIAAKSDLATVTVEQELDGELKAFEKVSQKAVVFLVDALGRYWAPTQSVTASQGDEGSPEGGEKPQPGPSTTVKTPPSNLPPNMGDL